MNDLSRDALGQRLRLGALRSLAHTTLSLPEGVLRAMVGPPRMSPDGMLLDLQVQAILWLMERARIPLIHEHPVERGRIEMDRTAAILAPRAVAPVSALDRSIDTPQGSVSLRVYRPEGPARARGVLVYFHGGGFVLGSIESHQGVCESLASRADCVVVSVAYRLAPEEKFPAGLEDGLAAFRAVAGSLESYGGSEGRVAVGGDSAGGNLAAVIALETRRDPVAPKLQVLIYPATDLTRSTRSHELFREGYVLTREGMDFFVDAYLPHPDLKLDPRASPYFTEDLSGAAPALVLTAGFDPLRDEGIGYARKLAAAGVKSEARCYPGLIHGFVSMAGGITAAEASLEDIARALRVAFEAR